MSKRHPNYSEEFRAGAIAWLEGQNYPEDKFALQRVADGLGIPSRTLRRWYDTRFDKPLPPELVQQKKVELSEAVESELQHIFAAMNTVRAEASYKDLATAAGILVDKKQLLSGKPTAINEDRVSDARDRLAQRLDRLASVGGQDGPARRPN